MEQLHDSENRIAFHEVPTISDRSEPGRASLHRAPNSRGRQRRRHRPPMGANRRLFCTKFWRLGPHPATARI